jgi:biotin carboxylase
MEGGNSLVMNLKGKRLLILGANPETAGLVQKANSMGVYTIVTDYQSGAYAKRFANKNYDVDAVDLPQLIDLAKKENIDGVMVGVAEALIPAYQKICNMLRFPCYGTAEQFQIFTNKANFKKVCKEYDIPVVPDYNISVDVREDELSKIEYPLVVKPVDSSGSKGISVCRDAEALKIGIQKALSFSNSKKLIFEKYMTGDEVMIFYLFQNGKPIFIAMCDRYTSKEQKGVAHLPTCYIFPSRYIDKYQREMDYKVKEMFKGLSVKNGKIGIQSFIENSEVRFHESEYRLGGNQSHVIVSAMTGIDYLHMMVNFALTGKMSSDNNIDIEAMSNPKFKKWGCKLSPLVKEGKICKLDGFEEISNIPEVISINPSYDEGDTVKGLGTLKQIIARFYIITDNLDRMSDVIDTIYEKLVVLDEHGKSMTLQPFDTRILKQNYGHTNR